ncbi:hypothetical protein [Corynebacterium kalidii]
MNIDVTVTRTDGHTWSEKFNNAYARDTDGSLLIYTDGQNVKVGTHEYKLTSRPIAEFAPGAWHSWRQVKD